MLRWLAYAAMPCLLWACSPEPQAAAQVAFQPDLSSPQGLLECLTTVAQGQADASHLVVLCDSQLTPDRDLRRICALGRDGGDTGSFQLYFRRSAVQGPVRFEADSAWIPIVYGPGGDRPAELHCLKVGGKWFLYSLLTLDGFSDI